MPGIWLAWRLSLVLTIALAGCSDSASNGPPSKAVAEIPAVEQAVDDNAVGRRGDPVAGKEVYDNYCHYCHGQKGMGDGPIGIAITPTPADLVHDKYRRSRSDEQLFNSITEGISRKNGSKEMAMPRWKDVLTEKQRWDVLAYIRQLQREYSSETDDVSKDAQKIGKAAGPQ